MRFLTVGLVIIAATLLNGINFSLKHELILWGTGFLDDSSQDYHLISNFKPDLQVNISNFDTKITLFLAKQIIRNDSGYFHKNDARLYRSWIRYSTNQLEVRAGLQKINFGPAYLLRALQWFDQLDPRDISNETKAVEAILARYYFLNNSNIWFWVVRGKEYPKGIEFYPGIRDEPEIGGRIQYPFEYCETALSYHQRKVSQSGIESMERRIGFDSRWDIEIGFWIEAMLSYFENTNLDAKWIKFITVGADYTIPLGNGIYVLSEHSLYEVSKTDFYYSDQENTTSSLVIRYPIDLFNQLQFICSYDWSSGKTINFLSYQLGFDYLDLFINVYSYPEQKLMSAHDIHTDGKSVQILFKLNF